MICSELPIFGKVQDAKWTVIRWAGDGPMREGSKVRRCEWPAHGRNTAAMIEATYACTRVCGVRTPGVNMITSRVMGTVRKDQSSREDVLRLMGY